MEKVVLKKGALARFSNEEKIKKKYSEIELNELDDILESDGEDRGEHIRNLEKIASIKHTRRDYKLGLMKVIGGWIGGVATTLLTIKVIDLGRKYDEEGIMNKSSISKPVNQSILKSIFRK